MSECYKHKNKRRQGSPCPYCRIKELKHDIDQYIEIDKESQRRIAELEADRKADCIAFAQWFRSGNNRDGRTEDECWELWQALEQKDE